METSRQERKVLFDHALRRDQKPARVPLFSNVSNWRILQSGYTLTQALNDYDIMTKVIVDFHKKYQYDAYTDMGGRNPIQVTDALGIKGHIINDEKGTVSYLDRKIMSEDDYDIIIKKGWKRWLLENYLPRRIVADTDEEFATKMDVGIQAMLKYFAGCAQTSKAMSEAGALSSAIAMALPPSDILMNWYRGMRNLSIDMRQRKEKVKEVCDIIWNETSPYAHDGEVTNANNDTATTKMFMQNTMNADDPNSMAMANHFASLLSNTIMSPSQFEYFVWPYLSQVFDYAAAHKQTVVLYAEADVLRYADYFNTIPKGTVGIVLEMDDLFEAKKVLGDHVTLIGGYPVNYLGFHSIEENIDLCKRIMDEVAYDGAWIYSENKIVSHKDDANPETLKAVLDFFRNAKY